MHVIVQYAAQARTAVGLASERVELAGPCRVGELLVRLATVHPELARLILTADRRPHPALLLFVGDRQVESGQLLQGGEVVWLMTPIAGG